MAPAKISLSSKLIILIVFIGIIILSLFIVLNPALAEGIANKDQPDFSSFIKNVQNGNPDDLRGVYVPGLLALAVVQQPWDEPGFVSRDPESITQFGMAKEAGIIGLLAHNYLAGSHYAGMKRGDEVRIIFGDGRVEYFIVKQILQYQALQPSSVHSDFRDLDTDIITTAQDVFRKVYSGDRHVTFQTCIEAEGNINWGRLFVIAEPKYHPILSWMASTGN